MGSCSSYPHPAVDVSYPDLGGETALALFSGPEVMVAGSEDDACHGPLLDQVPSYVPEQMSFGKGHQFFGINGDDEADNGLGSVRFGFGSNDETDSAWAALIGIGLANNDEARSTSWSGQTDCSHCDDCYGTLYDAAETSANLWVR